MRTKKYFAFQYDCLASISGFTGRIRNPNNTRAGFDQIKFTAGVIDDARRIDSHIVSSPHRAEVQIVLAVGILIPGGDRTAALDPVVPVVEHHHAGGDGQRFVIFVVMGAGQRIERTSHVIRNNRGDLQIHSIRGRTRSSRLNGDDLTA